MSEKLEEVTDIDVEQDDHAKIGPLIKRVVTIIAVLFSLYQLYSVGVASLPSLQHRAIHLSFSLILIFLLYPVSKKNMKKNWWLDAWPIVGSIFIGLYIVVNYMDLVYRAGSPTTLDLIVGAIAIVVTLEACRRTMGLALSLVAIAFILYNFFGNIIPGPIAH